MMVMQGNFYFPLLTRQPIEEYHNIHGEFYAASNYQQNYDMVAKDCKYRCVYCDVTVKECGGEPLSLDHFRPKALFVDKFDGILVRHPYNLHLSCQKCNVLKSKDWQGCKETIDGSTYLDGKGYIDRFEQNLLDFIEVDAGGRIQAKEAALGDKGPGAYMINRLHLNRPNRVYLRKKRHVENLASEIENLLLEYSKSVTNNCEAGLVSPEKGMANISKLNNITECFLNTKKL